MIYLVTKKGTVYIPAIYGCETWGGTSQDSIEKKRKHWYFVCWRSGYYDNPDYTEHIKINVALETTSLSEVLKFIRNLKLTKEEKAKKLDEIKEQIGKYLDFEKWSYR